MQIWIINHYAIPATQAGGTRHFSLGRELARRGHRVTIFSSAFLHSQRSGRTDPEAWGPPIRRECVDGVEFVWIRTPSYRGNGLARIRNMLSFATRVWTTGSKQDAGRPDVIVGSSPHPFAAYSALRLARRFGIPFVLEVRDLWPDSLIGVTKASPSNPMIVALRWLERHLYRSAAHIVSLLPNAVEHIRQHGGQPGRITWIPNGVDFAIAGAMLPARPVRGDEPFTVVYAGAMGSANGMDSLLEAASLLRDADPPLVFRFVGDGPERARLIEEAAARGLGNVRFDDPVSKQEVYEILRGADALLATTRNIDLYKHGLSLNKLFDYLAAGRPIVFGADCPGNPVLEADAGFIVPPENATEMARALHMVAQLSVEERHAIGRRGRAYAEQHHDIVLLAERLEGVLRRTVEVA